MTNNDDVLTVSGLNVSYGESKVLFDVSMNVRPGQVVACGGGLVVQPGMLDLLKTKGVVMCLHASLETILKRTAGHRHRPLLNVDNPGDRIRALYAERDPIYRRAGTVILTDARPLSDIVSHVLRAYRREAADWAKAHGGARS